jgi:hypothetical protein
MIEKTYTIKIKASSEQECKEVIQGLTDLVNTVKPKDLIRLSAAVKKKPGLVETALKWI